MLNVAILRLWVQVNVIDKKGPPFFSPTYHVGTPIKFFGSMMCNLRFTFMNFYSCFVATNAPLIEFN